LDKDDLINSDKLLLVRARQQPVLSDKMRAEWNLIMADIPEDKKAYI
jgi:hypothetical protein